MNLLASPIQSTPGPLMENLLKFTGGTMKAQCLDNKNTDGTIDPMISIGAFYEVVFPNALAWAS